MADKAQPEVTRMCKEWGLYPYKPPDLRFEDRDGKVTTKEKSVRSVRSCVEGQFDMMVFSGSQAFFWEVKTGEDTAFPFAAVRESQLDWYHREAKPRGFSTWLIFFIGERSMVKDNWQEALASRRSKDKLLLPRKCFLLPFGQYLELAAQQERKSFSYEYCATALTLWEVKRIVGSWELPKSHPFWKEAIGEPDTA